MIEWFTAGMQFVILVILGGITLSTWQSRRLVKQTNELIGAYRREIGWLTERIEMLEQSAQSKKTT